MTEKNQEEPVRNDSKNLFIWNDPTTWASKTSLEMTAYVAMVAGIVLLFSWPYLGGTIVGFIFSLFFFNEITQILKSLSGGIEHEGLVKTLLLLGLLLALFISQPAIFLGGAIGLAFKKSMKNWNP